VKALACTALAQTPYRLQTGVVPETPTLSPKRTRPQSI